ncbi:MAG: hypothetical protein KA113_15455 [Syntrophaceae bacterium]|nr:hypothetical protein [Syntrophaceae bacterium]
MNLIPNVKPMPDKIRAIKEKIFRPMPPPVFLNWPGTITPDDIALARELFTLLDHESQGWYFRKGGIFEGLYNELNEVNG